MTDTGIMIAMSGGVDSAVAAYLSSRTRRAAGVTMQIHSAGVGDPLLLQQDIEGARSVCAMLGLPHYVADVSAAFRRQVVDPFIASYEAGETPNPCVLCNKTIKFGALPAFALQHGFERLATGHYARLEHASDGRTLVRCAVDRSKDQTYMLWSLKQDILTRCEFPLGPLSKEQVRAIAEDLHFPMAHKKDSQDICFVPNGDYAAFIQSITGRTPTPGTFLDIHGNPLGVHQGHLHYTVGQRKGLGIALGKPAFVISKSACDNTVTLGDNADLFSTRLVAKNCNLIPFDRIERPMRLLAKTRYSQAVSPARVEQINTDTLCVEFDAPQRAICKGQSLVLYEDDYLIGGGIIC